MTSLLSLLEAMHADLPRAKRDEVAYRRSRQKMERKGRGTCGSGCDYNAFEAVPLGGIHSASNSLEYDMNPKGGDRC